MNINDKRLQKAIVKAKLSFPSFCEFCFVNSKSGKPWKLAKHHHEWAGFLSKRLTKLKPKYELSELINKERIVIWAPTDSGKSEFMSVAYPIWLLGHNTDLRVILVSNTSEQVEKFVSMISQHILDNERVKLVFPNLKPKPSAFVSSRAQKWTSRQLMLERNLISKDYSVSGYGAGGAILNARADVIICDDLLDLENTRSETQRNYIIEWLESTVLPRLTYGGQFVAIGTAWHPKDAMHHLSKKKSFFFVKYSLLEEDAADGYRIIDWEEGYPKERIRKDREDLGEREFARQKRCRPYLTGNRTFPNFTNCLMKTENWSPPTSGLVVSMGVDISSSSREGTTIFVLGVDSNTKIRYPLEVMFGKWTGPEINKMIIEVFDHFAAQDLTPSYVVVENNAVQTMVGEWLVDPSVGRPDLPLVPFTTGKNKADADIGLPSIDLEFERGLWVFPDFYTHRVDCACPWCRLKREIEAHPDYPTSDGVMAMMFARHPLRTMYSIPRNTRMITRTEEIVQFIDVDPTGQAEQLSKRVTGASLLNFVAENPEISKQEILEKFGIEENELVKLFLRIGVTSLDDLKFISKLNR